MNLREGRIREERASFKSAIGRRDIAPACVGREIKHVSISAGGEHDSIRGVSFNFSRTQATSNNSFRVSLDNYEIEHLRLREHFDRAGRDLSAKRLITAEQKLLTGLSARVECTRHLGAAKRTICQIAAVFASKRHS